MCDWDVYNKLLLTHLIFFGGTSKFKGSRKVSATLCNLCQGCPTGGPRAASGPRPLLIRPATTLQRMLFTDLCFAVIFYLLCVVNELTICWTEPVVCKFYRSCRQRRRKSIIIFKNARSSYWGSVPVSPNFAGTGSFSAKMLIAFDRLRYNFADGSF